VPATRVERKDKPAGQAGPGACGGRAPNRPAGPGQEHLATTAEPPQSPVTEGVRSLEVRWIFPGQLDTAVARWFGRFPAETQSREDTYLLDPQWRALSVKIRGGTALEVKAYRGSPGILEVAGRARGRLQYWQKWSFPCDPPSLDSGDQAGWRPVRKRRRLSRFTLASGQIVARAPGPGGEPRCQVEITEIRTHGQDWWTLGFEATGPADLLRSALEATAALVFTHALPGGLQPGPDDSRSYAEWLCQRPGAGRDADGLRLSSCPAGWAAVLLATPGAGPAGNARGDIAGQRTTRPRRTPGAAEVLSRPGSASVSCSGSSSGR